MKLKQKKIKDKTNITTIMKRWNYCEHGYLDT